LIGQDTSSTILRRGLEVNKNQQFIIYI